jgi:hypothetical protein
VLEGSGGPRSQPRLPTPPSRRSDPRCPRRPPARVQGEAHPRRPPPGWPAAGGGAAGCDLFRLRERAPRKTGLRPSRAGHLGLQTLFRGSEPFVGVLDLGASGAPARHRSPRCARVAVIIAVGRGPRTSGPLTPPRLFRSVHRRPSHQVSGLHPSVAIQAERRQFKRLAVNLAVSRPLGAGAVAIRVGNAEPDLVLTGRLASHNVVPLSLKLRNRVLSREGPR